MIFQVEALICAGAYETADSREALVGVEGGAGVGEKSGGDAAAGALLLNDPAPDDLDLPVGGGGGGGGVAAAAAGPAKWPLCDAWVVKYTDSSNAFGIAFVAAAPGPGQDQVCTENN